MKGSLIVVTGPEGVGKTTQIRILMRRIPGARKAYGYIRSGSTPVRLIKSFLVKIGRREETFTELGDRIVDADHLIVSKLINLFMVIDFVVGALKNLYYSMLGRLGYIVLFERYLNDLVLDYYYASLHYPLHRGLLRYMYMFSTSLSRRTDPLLIILDADLETLLSRQLGRRRSDLLVFTYVQKRIHRLISSTMSSRVYVIDTTGKGILEVNRELYRLITGGAVEE